MFQPQNPVKAWLLYSLLCSCAFAAGLYTKSSPVIQVDAKSYDRLIAKSNYTSIVEFYAPWCGHCQNLKPQYEKAASSLEGLAKVAAINCDEDSNKPFCGSMGVQGFPTLKIVKPSKKPGARAVVEDYNGQRTAKAIRDTVFDKIPNHVQRLKADTASKWLDSNQDHPKALFFSQKGLIPAFVKALAIDFRGSIDFGYVRDSERSLADRFGVESFPSVVLLPGRDAAQLDYQGEMKKPELVEFFSQIASPNPDARPKSPSTAKSSKKTKANTAQPASSPSEKASGCPVGGDLPKTESTIESLATTEKLRDACLQTRSGTCVLALQGDGSRLLESLGEIAAKHAKRSTKMLPSYSVETANPGYAALVKALGLSHERQDPILLVTNRKKAWWSLYEGTDLSATAIEAWLEDVKVGQATKLDLPEDILGHITSTEESSKESSEHGEL